MSPSSQIHDLVLAKLAGRKIDIVRFMDELLEVVQEFGAIHCSPAGEESLRFEMPNLGACEIKLDGCRGKLRMLCARLHILCQESSASTSSPYGGEGVIAKTAASRPANGKTNDQRWSVCFKNTPAKQEFTISPIKDSLAPTAAPLREATAAPSSMR